MGLDTDWYCCQHLQSRPRRAYNTLYVPNLSRLEVPKGASRCLTRWGGGEHSYPLPVYNGELKTCIDI